MRFVVRCPLSVDLHPRREVTSVINQHQTTDNELVLTSFLHRELLSALGSTAGKNSSAVLGAHAGAEAVNFHAATLLWLVCSLWHIVKG